MKPHLILLGSFLLLAFTNSTAADVAIVLNENPGVVMSVESQYVADIAK